LIDIIEKECFQGYQLNDLDKQKLRNQFENPSSILWILDGCDERTIPDYLQSIECELLDQSNLLLTSRPYVTDHLQYDSRIRIQDFDEKDIEKYIEKYFSSMFPERIKKCCSFIRDIGQLQEAARIPACLEIMCDLWESGQEEIFELGMTTAEIYEKMCEYLLRRYLLKFHGQNTSALAPRHLYEHPNAIAFTRLEYLAFKMTKIHEFEIKGNKLGDVADSLLLSVIQIGLLVPKKPNSSYVLVANTYYFVHRSFQEYLCARYMIRALSSVYSEEQKEEVIQFIISEKYNRNLQNTFRLFFELKRSPSCTNQFWLAVDSEPRDLVGLRHCSRIIGWFPNGTCGLPEDEDEINKRTIDAVRKWISKKDRRAHDFSNTYLFEWFSRETDHQCWLTAWKKDLLETDPSKRRYFLPDLWSTQNIDALKKSYNKIPEDKIQALHRLIMKGPMKHNLKRLNIDPELFTLLTVDDDTETLELVKTAQKIATKHESMTDPEKFKELLRNYASFARLNRRTEALDKETWRLKIDPSALINIDKKTLQLLLQLSEQNVLFYRDFDLPVVSFLELYANQNDLDDDILCSLIVSITLSSKCMLTAPPGEKKLIRVRTEDEKFINIELNEQRWCSLINKFDSARAEYGYSSFF
jgi:DNA-binding protein YbaB